MPELPRAVLTLARSGAATYTGPVPPAARGVWCILSIPPLAPSREATVAARIDILLTHGGTIPVGATLLTQRPSRFVIFLPVDSGSIKVYLLGHAAPPDQIALYYWGVSRRTAALRIARDHLPRLLRTALRCLRWNPRGLFGRLRGELGNLGQTGQRVPYAVWCTLFDRWGAAAFDRFAEAADRANWPAIDCFVIHAGGAEGPIAATRDSASASLGIVPNSILTIDPEGDGLTKALAASDAPYVAVLQAGEILAPHALAVLAASAARLGNPAILYADDDAIAPSGERSAPQFKPPPNHTAMLSGAPCTGVWLIRRDAMNGVTTGGGTWAEALRLDAWLRLYEKGLAGETHRLPYVLTHRSAFIAIAPASAVAKVVSDHVDRSQLPATVAIGRPPRVRFHSPRDRQPHVSIVIPSACRSPHVMHYIGAVLAKTDYSSFDIVIAVSSAVPLDAIQSGTIAALTRDPRVRHLPIRAAAFNYASVNNIAVRTTDGPLICLLNDDIAPLTADWLAIMVGHLADPAVGIVGARLSYEDRSVQHAGVVMLPDGTGEHLHRFTPDHEIDNDQAPLLSQEVSCVTGACLLTRRTLWDRLGGMDEAYPSAFNDVDFCLRARELGQGVVFAADAHLLHAESITFGKHYGLQEMDRNMADRLRLRSRFPGVFESDPFHNPNLSLVRGDCLGLAVPPRARPFDDILPSSA